MPVRRSVQDCATRGKIHRFIAAQIRHTRGRDCEAASSSRRVERICKISVFPAPLARAHWLVLNHMQCIRVNSLNSWLTQPLVKRRHLLGDGGPGILFLDETLAILTHLNAFRVRKCTKALQSLYKRIHIILHSPSAMFSYNVPSHGERSLPNKRFAIA